jgi:hypothetical protein
MLPLFARSQRLSSLSDFAEIDTRDCELDGILLAGDRSPSSITETFCPIIVLSNRHEPTSRSADCVLACVSDVISATEGRILHVRLRFASCKQLGCPSLWFEADMPVVRPGEASFRGQRDRVGHQPATASGHSRRSRAGSHVHLFSLCPKSDRIAASPRIDAMCQTATHPQCLGEVPPGGRIGLKTRQQAYSFAVCRNVNVLVARPPFGNVGWLPQPPWSGSLRVPDARPELGRRPRSSRRADPETLEKRGVQ